MDNKRIVVRVAGESIGWALRRAGVGRARRGEARYASGFSIPIWRSCVARVVKPASQIAR